MAKSSRYSSNKVKVTLNLCHFAPMHLLIKVAPISDAIYGCVWSFEIGRT